MSDHPQIHLIYHMEAEWLLYVASPVSLLCGYRSKGSSPVGWVIIMNVSHSNWIRRGYEGPLYCVHAICLYSMDLYCHSQKKIKTNDFLE